MAKFRMLKSLLKSFPCQQKDKNCRQPSVDVNHMPSIIPKSGRLTDACINARTWVHIALIICLSLATLLPGTGLLPLLDRDEPRFARATVEMMDRGEWVIPYFNGEYRFDKPVMTYWLMRGSYWLFGINEFGARFHSIISTLLIALAVYGIGMRLFFVVVRRPGI